MSNGLLAGNENENENLKKVNLELIRKESRFSLPMGSVKDSKRMIPNRRHTLVPGRGILKPSIDGNHTINLVSDTMLKERRRVSFAPEVTLHKINYSHSNNKKNQKKKNSLLEDDTQKSSKLNTSQYLGKVYNIYDKTYEVREEMKNEIPLVDNVSDLPPTDPFMIDEDSTTQTMEMSIELTQKILKQQEEMEPQEAQQKEEPFVINTGSLRDIFDEVEKELSLEDQKKNSNGSNSIASDNDNDNDNDKDNEVEMELTETAFGPSNSSTQDYNQAVELSMEMTQPVLQTTDIGKETKTSINVSNVSKTTNINQNNFEEDGDTMEFTQPISRIQNGDETIGQSKEPAETLEFTQMEFTQPISNSQETINELIKEDTEPMELTQPILNAVLSQKTNNFIQISDDEKLSTVIEVSEPPTSANSDLPTKDLEIQDFESLQNQIDTKPKDQDEPQNELTDAELNGKQQNNLEEENDDHFNRIGNEEIVHLSSEANIQHDELENKQFKHPITDYKDMSSEMETSLIGTEMVPLAEVTEDFTDSNDSYDSDNSFTDDYHVNVPLGTFLQDVNVQFYDTIGPSENEIEKTMIINSDLQSSPMSSSSPATSVSTSSNSTPSSTSLSNKRVNLSDYIDACANIPYYHYLVHLINQYQTSIQSISTMVNTFSNDVLESNPIAIREYYQQSEQIRNDLSTNYQAIAAFTRTQAKCQNMRFVSGLLEQLILSYEHANQKLETDLDRALEWRKGVLIERQKMIEKKVELDQYIQKLNSLRDHWNSVNIEKIKQASNDLKNYRDNRKEIKEKISEKSKSLSSEIKILSEKKSKKEQILKEIQELKARLKKLKVPSQEEMKLLKQQLLELEKIKGVKLLSTDNISILISSRLKVVFNKSVDNDLYSVEISVDDPSHFAPFSGLVTKFIEKYKNPPEKIGVLQFIKQLVKSWNEFILIWKELLNIYYLHSSVIDNSQFKLHFNFFQPIGSSSCNRFLIEGSLLDLLDTDKNVSVDLTSEDYLNDNRVDAVSVLDGLKTKFAKKDSFINRFILK